MAKTRMTDGAPGLKAAVTGCRRGPPDPRGGAAGAGRESRPAGSLARRGGVLQALLLWACGALWAAGAPDLIVIRGKIATVDAGNSMVEAMAVRDDIVVALGTTAEILKLAGPETKTLDVAGRTVLPGIVDPHWHLANYLDEDFPELRGIRIPPAATHEATKAAIEEAIRQKVAASRPGEWILAYPTGNLAREVILFEIITRADLDRVAPGNPVVLNEVGTGPASQILLNSRARQLMERDLTGFARFADRDVKGVGTDLGATVIKDVALKGRDVDFARSLRKYLMRTTPPSGITSSGSIITRVPLNAFHILDREGALPLRFGWLYGYASYFDPEGFYRRFPNMPGNGTKYLFNIGVGEELTDSPATGLCTTVAIRSEQLRERFRRSMLDPCFLSNAAMRSTVKDQIAYGRPVEYHAGGDRTIDLIFEIIEEVRRETGMTVEEIREKRITMEHTILVRPDQFPRLKEYGIIMTLAASHMNSQLNPEWPSNVALHLGEEYVKWHQPARSLVNAGVHTIIAEVGGRPFVAMARFVTREACFTPRLPAEGQVGERTCRVLTPSETIDRITALKMMTVWSAAYLFKEKEVGSLEKGKFADFIVLDRDYFTVPEKEIADIQVVMTVLGGKVIFASPPAGPVDRALFKSPDYFGKAQLAN